jgi:hypothetical protein
MSIAPAESQQEDAAAPSGPRRFAKPRPVLPIVQISSRKPLVVFYSDEDAASAAKENPEDCFYDVLGSVLTRAQDSRGRSRLDAIGEPDPVEFRKRLIADLRRTGEALRGALADEYEAIVMWLEAAPAPAQIVHGLGLAPVKYHRFAKSPPCIRGCTALQRTHWGTPPCCPAS